MSNLESSVKVIPYSQERVYNKLSDLNHLAAIKERLPKYQIQDLSCDSDSLSFSIPPSVQLSMQIVERKPCESIKLVTTNSPIPFTLWIQLTETGAEECTLKIIVSMNVNPFMKAMVEKPMKENLEKLVNVLSLVSY